MAAGPAVFTLPVAFLQVKMANPSAVCMGAFEAVRTRMLLL